MNDNIQHTNYAFILKEITWFIKVTINNILGNKESISQISNVSI